MKNEWWRFESKKENQIGNKTKENKFEADIWIECREISDRRDFIIINLQNCTGHWISCINLKSKLK